MSALPGRSSWQARRSLAVIPLMVMAMLLALILAAELVVRSDAFRSRVLPPSVGTPSRLIDQHLFQMEDLERGGISFDCIVIGNSLPLVGIDPDAVDAVFDKATGNALSCYDFGVPGVRADGAAVLGRVLQEDFRPWLTIYATSA